MAKSDHHTDFANLVPMLVPVHQFSGWSAICNLTEDKVFKCKFNCVSSSVQWSLSNLQFAYAQCATMQMHKCKFTSSVAAQQSTYAQCATTHTVQLCTVCNYASSIVQIHQFGGRSEIRTILVQQSAICFCCAVHNVQCASHSDVFTVERVVLHTL